MFNLNPKKILFVFGAMILIILGVFFFIISKPLNHIYKNQTELQTNSTKLKQTPPSVVKDIPILVYHSVAPLAAGHHESNLQKRFRVDPENFMAQMQYLKKNNYTPITFAHLAEYLLYDKEIPEKPIVITFDDGLLNQYQNAFPVLKKFGFVATFFIYPGVTGHRSFVNWEQIKEIVNANDEIGSHTIIHYNLTRVDDKTMRHELEGSKKILEDKLGITVSTIAYPDYAKNEAVIKATQDAGYIAARAGWGTIKNSADQIFSLKAQEAGNTKNPFVAP